MKYYGLLYSTKDRSLHALVQKDSEIPARHKEESCSSVRIEHQEFLTVTEKHLASAVDVPVSPELQVWRERYFPLQGYHGQQNCQLAKSKYRGESHKVMHGLVTARRHSTLRGGTGKWHLLTSSGQTTALLR